MNIYTRAEAVFLLLDPSKHKSGALITRPGGAEGLQIITGALVSRQLERAEFVQSAKELASAWALPLIVVAEEWDPPRGSGASRVDKRWNYKTILGMGEGWGKWTAEFERHEVSLLDVVRVTPNTWRDKIFGEKRETDGAKLKQDAISYIERRLRLKLAEDMAEAACMGFWALHSPDVHHRIEVWHHKNGRRRGV